MITDLIKTVKVIRSCKTHGQLAAAAKTSALLAKKSRFSVMPETTIGFCQVLNQEILAQRQQISLLRVVSSPAAPSN